MNEERYRNAMNQLPFRSDLENNTIQALKAASGQNAKEESPMNSKQPEHTRKEKPSSRRRPHTLVLTGSLLAAAACLALALLPTRLQNPESLHPATSNPKSVDGAAIIATNASEAEDAAPLLSATQAIQAGGSTADSAPAARMSTPMEADTGMDSEAILGEDWDTGETTFNHIPMATSPAADSPPSMPQWNTEEYNAFQENRFLSTRTSPFSTFAADVDTASYAKLRSAILSGQSVPADSVRIEEMLNYFHYDYPGPREDEPFGITTEIAACPWNEDTQLLLIGLQAEKIDPKDIPAQNLVFLIDVSGSMEDANKLPLVKKAFLLLLEQLQPTDTLSIITYASSDRVVLEGVQASQKTTIMDAIEQLEAGGGTAGAAGIHTAYQLAEKYFIAGGNNRILLATDGDLNIGVSDEGSLTRLVEEKRNTGVYLSVLGFGTGNYKDHKLEATADHGNGNYAYIDTLYEARKALVEELGGTFLTVAKDVKLQVEFNPAHVKGYRLIGYENRTMAAEDFADDSKDGGELGSGHRVTVLYEIVPTGSPMEIAAQDSKYQATTLHTSEEWLTLNVRCKKPEGDASLLYSYPVFAPVETASPSDNMAFAASVAECGMLLRNSEHKGTASYQAVLERLRSIPSVRGDVYKEEFQYIVTLLGRTMDSNSSAD